MENNLSKNTFYLLVALVTIGFLGLIGGFLMACFWAIVFAILFHGSYEHILAVVKGKQNVAAGLTLLYILLIVIIPLIIISFAVVNEAQHVYTSLEEEGGSSRIEAQIEQIREYLPMTEKALDRLGIDTETVNTKISELVSSASQLVAGKALQITGDVFGFFISFVIMLYILFFFIRDGNKLAQKLVWALPMDDEKEWELLTKFESVARATVKGSLLVALIQGTLGGILFWAVGIPAAFLWGILMVLASLLPVGNAIIWAPWGISLIVSGHTTSGIIVLVVGAGFIGLVDNLLRPRLVGKDTKLPDYLILLSSLGGLAWFGLSGFVIGPIVAAFFTTCWEMMGREHGHDLSDADSIEP